MRSKLVRKDTLRIITKTKKMKRSMHNYVNLCSAMVGVLVVVAVVVVVDSLE
jgi:hypothetical protein